jgi:hypothetical protein
MTTEDQLQLPHIETVGNDTIEFPRLDVDELAHWANEVKAKRVADESARLKLDPTHQSGGPPAAPPECGA